MRVDDRLLVGRLFTVLGAAGFVGQRVVARLRAAGARVYAPVRDDPALWQQPLGQVIYAAGLTADYLARPFDTVQAHVSLLAQVLQRSQWEALVYLSSTRLYDSLGAIDCTESLPLQLDPAQPRHLYDLSKALGESLCHSVGQGRARIARLACVYEGLDDADGFLPGLLRQALAARVQARAAGPAARGVLSIDSSPAFERDYVQMADAVEALLHILLQGQSVTYNVASGCNVSNAALFNYLAQHGQCDVQAMQTGTPNPAPQISIARMRTEFDWQPRSVFDLFDSLYKEPGC